MDVDAWALPRDPDFRVRLPDAHVRVAVRRVVAQRSSDRYARVRASIRGGGDCARQSAASALMHGYVWVKFCKPRRAINRSISKRYAGSFFSG